MIGFFVVLVTLILTFFAPLVAYPLAGILKRARQGIDDRIQWTGPNAERNEAIEDGITNLSLVLVSIVIYLMIGILYTWYVQMFVYPVHPWLYRLVPSLPVLGSASLGYYDTLPFLYWTIVFWVAYGLGRRNTKEAK